jgi:hypothetical protein
VQEAISEVRQLSPVLLLQRADANLVDEIRAALVLESELGLVRFVRADKILADRVVDHAEPGLDRVRVVGGAVLPEQVLEYINRDVRADLDLSDEIFADHLSAEHLICCPVQLHLRPSIYTAIATRMFSLRPNSTCAAASRTWTDTTFTSTSAGNISVM